MRAFLLLTVLLAGCGRTRERIICVGLDTSGTAYRGGNPYDSNFMSVLAAVRGSDHLFAALIDQRGLANGVPFVDWAVRPYSFITDKRTDYDEALRLKREKARQALTAALKTQKPASGTEIIGFMHTVAQIFRAFAGSATKYLVLFTDAQQESGSVNLARLPMTDREIDSVIEGEQREGRLPKLIGVEVWFVTGPSLQNAAFDSKRNLWLEKFWTKYIQASGGRLRAYSPVLINFGGEE